MMYNSKRNIDIDLLMRYLEDNVTSEESNIVKRWFSNLDIEPDIYEESLHFWEATPLEPSIKGYTGVHILSQIHHKIKIEEEVFLKTTKPRIRFINYLTRVAAILFIPLLVSSFLYYFRNISNENSQSYCEIYAPFGTRTNFSLPDGSIGKLNGGSSLKFPNQFDKNARNVELTGEAFFNVTPNSKKPFIVSTDHVDVKVIGTAFNVTAYADEETTIVTLESGKVEVFKKTNNMTEYMGFLNPSESFIFNAQTDSGHIYAVNTSDYLSWIDGKLSFKYEPFEDVIHKINHWYNVDIVIKDEILYTYIYYGTFQDETLDEVLKLLQHTAPIRYLDIAREKKQDGTFEKRKIEIYCNK